ncbi:hypothetical protein GPECTOR_30g201 [Gonium pectorale]|uniref:Guanylate cyclase domain-containing protein n=1 Tax=Gonium pectorale TaxID=33097 RepID=A0A150GE41_GONPE|nr:hypothetical protein GPECTOR_30g201 [Gonium pectorale]|eukprot:KXZ48106.1 hypothetical protein GPECTOR_30g201 [Gonium pectorale]
MPSSDFDTVPSIAYYGNRVARVADATEDGGVPALDETAQGESTLAELFRLEPTKLDRLLFEVLEEGRTWKGDGCDVGGHSLESRRAVQARWKRTGAGDADGPPSSRYSALRSEAVSRVPSCSSHTTVARVVAFAASLRNAPLSSAQLSAARSSGGGGGAGLSDNGGSHSTGGAAAAAPAPAPAAPGPLAAAAGSTAATGTEGAACSVRLKSWASREDADRQAAVSPLRRAGEPDGCCVRAEEPTPADEDAGEEPTPAEQAALADEDAEGVAEEADVAGLQAAPLHRVAPRWHEMTAVRSVDPVTGKTVVLLSQIFPRHVLAHMAEEGGPWNVPGLRLAPPAACQRPVGRNLSKLATSHDEVTLMFADIEGFTTMCKVLEPHVVMAFLDELYTRFDSRLDTYGVYKVETIGDCYFVAGGLMARDEDGAMVVRRGADTDPLHAKRVFDFSKSLLAAAAEVKLPTTGGPVRMRVGIHSGPVVSGVVGQRMPRFCLFDSLNPVSMPLAPTSRMESTGVPGCIHASEAAHAHLRNEEWVPTGGIEVKGKGRMNTYLWSPPADGPEHRNGGRE